MRSEGRDSFEQWARSRQSDLLRMAFWMTGDDQRAEDLVQDALIGVAERWDSLRDGNPDGWVRTVVFRANVSWWRRHRQEVLVADVPEGEAPAAGGGMAELKQALMQLAPRQRAVVLLRYVEDMSVVETASILGVTPGTVKKQASLALERLRNLSPGLRELVEDAG